MKRLFLFLGTVLIPYLCWCQQLSVSDLLEASALPAKKNHSYFSKKGYTPVDKSYQNDTLVETWQETIRITATDSSKLTPRRISRYQYDEYVSFCFQTPLKDEYTSVINFLKADGFFCGERESMSDSTFVFQKKNITVNAWTTNEDSVVLYSLYFHQQQMPSPRDVSHAEDLLQFYSHEYLAGFFGAENVKKDLYFFSKKELIRCSVLFPNSARQVIFIWKDEQNLRDLSHLLIGGNMTTEGSTSFNQQIKENTWSLANGVRFNMRLSELIRVNGEDFNFFGRRSDNFLAVAPKNKGNIDFSNTGIVLDCLNCDGVSFLNKELVQASDAVDHRISLYVGMIMLIPPSK
jgi:hypothetical protein